MKSPHDADKQPWRNVWWHYRNRYGLSRWRSLRKLLSVACGRPKND